MANIKEFKGICDGLATIHMHVDEDNKVIKFARGLGLKYKTFKTIMLGKAPYPTFNQFINALRGFDMRKDKEEVPQQNHNMRFFPKEVGEKETTLKEEETITLIPEEEVLSLLDREHE